MGENLIEVTYPLSPLQHGILFHALNEPDARTYFQQLTFTIRGYLNTDVFREAWQRLVGRHAILRTSVAWKHREKPLQIVYGSIEVPWEQYDLRKLAISEREDRLESLLRQDRSKGFDLATAPLIRLHLLQIADDEYYFVWSYHHLLLDGWSVNIVLDDLFHIYENICDNKQLQVDVPRPYHDYIDWYEKQSIFDSATFWRQELKGFTEPTSFGLKASNESSPIKVDDYGEQQRRLSTTRTTSIEAFTRAHHVTLATIAQAAWALLLSHYSDEHDVVYGFVTSGRDIDLIGVESMVGLLMNTVPRRVKVPRKEPVLSWLQHLQEKLVGISAYEWTSLTAIREWSEIPRGMPLFESIVVVENMPRPRIANVGDERLVVDNINTLERTHYPVTVVVEPGSELRLGILYDRRRLSGGMVSRILDHFETVLVRMVSQPSELLAAISLLSNAERRRLLITFNTTEVPYPSDTCLHALIAQHAEHSPDALALVAPDGILTYAELDRRSTHLAGYLQQRGVGPEVIVGVCLERSCALLVGLLAILKAGGAYLPLDPAYPPDRLAYMLTNSRATIVLTQSDLATLVASYPAVFLDTAEAESAPLAALSEASTVTSTQLAYVLYTSGSTGKPKGVAVIHAGLSNLVAWHQRRFNLRPDDRVSQLANLSFDAAGWELWPALAAGSCVYMAPIAALASPERLHSWLLESRITVAFVPTPLAETILPLSWPTTAPLRTLLVGGDVLRRGPTAGLPFEVVNNYGPTEATVVTTSGTVEPESITTRQPSIGRPVDNIQVYIVDTDLTPVPIDVAGEICIGGVGLARGYVGQREETAQRFIPNPFGGVGSRLYRTGDRGRYREDGTIEYLGRRDEQVQIRGMRVELGEVETTLTRHSGISQAIVRARPGSGNSELVAYIVERERGALPDDELRQYLLAQLPAHMVPIEIVRAPALPLTPNGKVDRRALPRLDTVVPGGRTAYDEPRTDLEQTLTEIWKRILKVDEIGRGENYFNLGGNSLHMMLVRDELESIGYDVPTVDMFRYPSISLMAEHLVSTQRQESVLRPESEQSKFKTLANRQKQRRERPNTHVGGDDIQ